MQYSDFGSCEALKQDILDVVIDQCFINTPVHSTEDFTLSLKNGKGNIMAIAEEYCQLLSDILDEYKNIKKILKHPPLTLLDTVADIQSQLSYLLPSHFLAIIDKQWIQQYPRYLKAIGKRLEKSQDNISRDRQHRLQLSQLWEDYLKRHETLAGQHIVSEQLEHYRWMLEEYRVSLFAQELKTPFPVSEKRLKAYWRELSDA